MITLGEWLALAILVALALYLILGGADFGGGIWDLFARGPRAKAQRDLIDKAIAPVWEANHVWLILALVLMFGAFPKAFHRLATELYFPLSILLVGIVIRGASLIFRDYGPGHSPFWGRLFASTSLLAPFCLGWCWGVVRSGKPVFSLAVIPSGLAVVWICAYLAAAYLTGETRDAELRKEFRARALLLGHPLIIAALILGLAQMPRLMEVVVFLLGAGSFLALRAERYRIGRLLAAATMFFLSVGWGMAQYPFLIYPDISIANSAAPSATLFYLLLALAGGAIVLLPSLVVLFRIFKR